MAGTSDGSVVAHNYFEDPVDADTGLCRVVACMGGLNCPCGGSSGCCTRGNCGSLISEFH